MKKWIIFTSILLTQSCSLVMPSRSFTDEMERESEGIWIAGEDFPLTSGDDGQIYRDRNEIAMRTPATRSELISSKEERSLQEELSKLENRQTESEYRQYMVDKDSLTTTSERIYYLKLNRIGRRDYMRSKVHIRQDRRPAAIGSSATLQPQNDEYDQYGPSRIWQIGKSIEQGMKKSEVTSIFGRPTRVDVAGNPRNENERWAYRTSGRVQYIYFENGMVQGWILE